MVKDNDTDFSIHNIPFGIFSVSNRKKRVGTIIGEQVIDLFELAQLGVFDDLKIKKNIFQNNFLNDFIALGKIKTIAVREKIQKFFLENKNSNENIFFHHSKVKMHLPIKIGDYTDFYSSEQHATNVGAMFRDKNNALLPNWKYLPVAYHGRASSIFVSGTNFHRPKGQMLTEKSGALPVFQATQQLDFELEVATVIGKQNENGNAVDINEADNYVFGFLLFNDWSARDIQRWEYAPLGPFLGKNFFSSVSPWIITAEALSPFRVEAPIQSPEVLPYLKEKTRHTYNIQLEVFLETKTGSRYALTVSNFKYLYWTVAQQIAHHTVNGCNLNVGDILASGTISGDLPDSFGSFLELSWNGKNPVIFPDGTTRRFIEDGDSIIITGFAEKNGARIGLGEVRNTCLPALP